MTAIVGVINRRGVAFAADSAATHTVSSKIKITNHANKVFQLSRSQPVGVALCGNIDFLGMPWEEIIKMFRDYLKEDSFPSLVDYPMAFFRFVKDRVMPFFELDQKNQMTYLVMQLINEANRISINRLKDDGFSDERITIDQQIPIMYDWLGVIESDYSPPIKNVCEDFESYSMNAFTEYCGTVVQNNLSSITNRNACPASFVDRFLGALYAILRSDTHVYLSTTELVFWGYGDSDMFPSYHSFVISASFDGRIKWTEKSKYEVSNLNPACVEPFAQTDVSNTVVRGIDDELRKRFYSSHSEIMSLFKKELATALSTSGAPNELVRVIESIDTNKYSAIFQKGMDKFILENYVQKLVDTITYLSKEDIADMAESLVRMTCLKRHITTDEETVGGPVDVAVITKGDGFIWLKRKHYFSSDINHQYFERRK